MGLIIKKCDKCKALVELLKDCTCGDSCLNCCGEPMKEVGTNFEEYDFELHLPKVEICENYIVVSVNHVMEEKHYIEWIALETNKTIGKKFFKFGEQAKAIFPYVKGSKVYAYCNIHGMWMTEV